MHQHHQHQQHQLHYHLNFAGLLLAWNIIAAVEQLLKLLLQSHVHVNWWREHLSCKKGKTKHSCISNSSLIYNLCSIFSSSWSVCLSCIGDLFLLKIFLLILFLFSADPKIFQGFLLLPPSASPSIRPWSDYCLPLLFSAFVLHLK